MFHKENLDYNRNQVGFYTLDELVPQAHFLRQVEQVIDFSFIYDLVADTYSEDKGRPSLDPVMLVKIPLIQCSTVYVPCAKLSGTLRSIPPIAGFWV